MRRYRHRMSGAVFETERDMPERDWEPIACDDQPKESPKVEPPAQQEEPQEQPKRRRTRKKAAPKE